MLILPSIALELLNFPDNLDFKGNIVNKFLLRRHLSIYDNKTMETFTKYVACIMKFFIPFNCVILYQVYSITFPVLLKMSNYGIRKMKIFCIYDSFVLY